ncbi:MAG TPA: L,D-transpeptidase [Actinomycetota bacterium]|nr:L,D-transpeptidase [Actinomycetota bacterium]
MAPRPLRIVFLVAVAILGASCRSVASDVVPGDARTSAPAASSAPGAFLELGSGAAPRASAPTSLDGTPAPRSLDRWAWVLRAKDDVLTVFDDPADGAELRRAIDAVNPYGQPIAFPVREAHAARGEAWYRVLLGAEPNGSNGWVRGSDVVFDRIRHRVVVDLSSRTLRHYREGELVHRFAVGIGAPSTPTTTGRFFVWAHLDPRDPTGPYGSYLLGLSGFSKVLTDWPGGGRMAIHGTDDPDDPGNRVSYGCARVFNPQMDRLRTIPMGTTVLIRP